MEIKKSKKADLEGTRTSGLLIGYIFALAIMFACFQWTTREYEETEPVVYAAYAPMEEEIVPITQPIITAAPPPPADTPPVAEILDIVDNNTEIEETEIESTEETTEATAGPAAQVSHGASIVADVGPAQEEEDENEIFEILEDGPAFPGGDAALMQYFNKNIKYPQAAIDKGARGTVLVRFVVNKDGSVVDAQIAKSVEEHLDKEALRVVSAMPKWKPGKQRGKPVRCRFSVPVRFVLQQ